MSEGPKKPVYSATRRLHLKTKMLKKAASMLVAEEVERKRAKESTLEERVPPLKLTGLALDQLQLICKDLIKKSDEADDARYDMENKVQKNDKEIQALAEKVFELKGAKRPNLKRVKKPKQDIITIPEVSSKTDFKVSLKTHKKAEEKKEEVTDWRKNVDAMAGMDGRKKMFAGGN